MIIFTLCTYTFRNTKETNIGVVLQELRAAVLD